MSLRARVGLVACLLPVAVSVPAAASHGDEPHLPMRDRGGRVGQPRACDGVLFTTSERSRPMLWYLRIGTRPKRAMTFRAGVTIGAAAIAPNGRTVAIEVESPAPYPPAAMSAFSRMRVAASTGTRLVIADLPVRGRRDLRARFAGSSPSWSRDGRRLAFERGNALLVASSTAWRKAEFVTWGETPAWSPRENVLAFVADRDVHVVTLQGTARLTHDTRIDSAPVWSPDGRSIVFGRRKRLAGWEDLWVMSGGGRRERRLTHFSRYNGALSPLWSPDGRRIAFTMANSEASGLRTVDAATGKVVAPAHPVSVGLGPFTRAGAWISPRSLVYETGITRRGLWQLTLGEWPVRLVPRLADLRVLDTGLCGAPPRR